MVILLLKNEIIPLILQYVLCTLKLCKKSLNRNHNIFLLKLKILLILNFTRNQFVH